MKSKEFEKLSPKSKQQYFNLYIAWMQLKTKGQMETRSKVTI
jgi:hypothetical protein